MIPSIIQLAGAILLAILIFLRSDKQSIQSTMIVVTVQGKKNPKIKDAIKETWIIRIGLILVIIGYLLQMLNVDSQYLLSLSRLYKLLITMIISLVLIGLSMFISSKIANYKFDKLKPFDMNGNDDNSPNGGLVIKLED
ncbi:hypothetical protein [Priestia aryabhattai]|uniref:Uncharacterized protein n=1 Tax=Priestia aryabhattai TaxID=412384 RepID=A0ABD7X398_PRIAR|nr:hypothetical protein [Priestia aryabhattai]WEA46828.1 hypothetical protein PWO00_12950 [Priestia aryabhattai]